MKLGLRQINYGLWFLIAVCFHQQAIAHNIVELKVLNKSLNKTNKQNQKSFCSQQNVKTLTTQLLRDLPSYANRAIQRARRLSRSKDLYSYMLVAGKPEFLPLPLNPFADTAETPNNAAPDVEQVFFTTLERQYIKGKSVELQQFHWLFLTQTESGWRIVMMFSQTGSYPKKTPPTPPRDSSNGILAQAIKTWLQDCRAGTLRMYSRKSED